LRLSGFVSGGYACVECAICPIIGSVIRVTELPIRDALHGGMDIFFMKDILRVNEEITTNTTYNKCYFFHLDWFYVIAIPSLKGMVSLRTLKKINI
jgi:hypothetical protein